MPVVGLDQVCIRLGHEIDACRVGIPLRVMPVDELTPLPGRSHQAEAISADHPDRGDGDLDQPLGETSRCPILGALDERKRICVGELTFDREEVRAGLTPGDKFRTW